VKGRKGGTFMVGLGRHLVSLRHFPSDSLIGFAVASTLYELFCKRNQVHYYRSSIIIDSFLENLSGPILSAGNPLHSL